MSDFERWFQQQGREAVPAPAAEPELPAGLYFRDGKLMATCRACEQEYEWAAQPREFTADMSYCGGSPRCLP